MEFSIATLLSNFQDDKLVAAKVLEKKLGCHDEADLQKLQIALDALEKIGILVKERGKYRRVLEDDVVEAKLRCSSKGFCFAIQNVEGAADIYVRESNLSTAWNGDRVLVRIIKEGNRRRSPEGEVRLILERANPSVLARVKQAKNGFRAVPLDDRLLFELDLKQNGQDLSQSVDHLVHVEVLRYPLAQYPPIGRVAQVLGSDAEAAEDIDIVCCKHDLPRNFPEAVLAQASEITNTKLRKADLKNRIDLRHLITLGINLANEQVTANSTNSNPLVEQAFTLERTDAERWRVGIHITDVAPYIEPDSPLDWEAKRRGTTVYLEDSVIPMLPPTLLEYCSLLTGQDHLAISVLVTLDRTGQVVEFEIQPTVIQVDYQLTAKQADAILLRHQSVGIGKDLDEWAPVFATLDQLLALSQAVREQRRQRGALELYLPETNSFFNDEGAAQALVALSTRPTRSMVRDLMVLVNQVIAQHLQALAVPAMYRVQPAPDLDDVQELLKLALNLRLDLHPTQEDAITSQDYQRFIQQFATAKTETVLNSLLQSTLKPAGYSTTPGFHFSLATSAYTHCISPAQRYADLLVQRVCHALFEKGRDRRTTRTKEQVDLHNSSCHGQISWNVLPPMVQEELEAQLTSVVVSINELEKEAQEAEADLSGLKKAELMKERIGEVLPGIITGVQSYGFFVEMEVSPSGYPTFRVEGLVHVSSLKDDWYEYRSRQEALVGRKNRKQYRLGDRVEVQIKSVDYYRQQIDLVTVGSDGDVDEDTEDSIFPNFDDE